MTWFVLELSYAPVRPASRCGEVSREAGAGRREVVGKSERARWRHSVTNGSAACRGVNSTSWMRGSPWCSAYAPEASPDADEAGGRSRLQQSMGSAPNAAWALQDMPAARHGSSQTLTSASFHSPLMPSNTGSASPSSQAAPAQVPRTHAPVWKRDWGGEARRGPAGSLVYARLAPTRFHTLPRAMP
jgi:hypothetical protein